MNPLPKLYQRRYDAAKKLFVDLQAAADKHGATVFVDGTPAYANPFYRIEKNWTIVVPLDAASTCVRMYPIVSYDEGLHTKTKDYRREFEKSFTLWKRIKS